MRSSRDTNGLTERANTMSDTNRIDEPSEGGVPSQVRSRAVTSEDRRVAIEEARRETKPLFHLTDGHISHIRNEEAKTKM